MSPDRTQDFRKKRAPRGKFPACGHNLKESSCRGILVREDLYLDHWLSTGQLLAIIRDSLPTPLSAPQVGRDALGLDQRFALHATVRLRRSGASVDRRDREVELLQGATTGLAYTALVPVLIALVRYLIIRVALKGAEPQDRVAILNALAAMFRSEWQLGPLRRTPSSGGVVSSATPRKRKPSSQPADEAGVEGT